jgi:hypothetical protein
MYGHEAIAPLDNSNKLDLRLLQKSLSTHTVCVLAVPADMANADLFTFFGSYMAELSTMRMVRREDVSKSVCMAVLDFKASSSAQSFIKDFNGKPYSSLEPDIICRVVAVAAVHMQPESQAILEAPVGHTELPTCPVCLERLDTHISGVITTVLAAPNLPFTFVHAPQIQIFVDEELAAM